MDGQRLVSVVIPIYNAQAHLETGLMRLMAQSYEAVEYILVDDGSKDLSGSICDRIAATQSRVRVIHQENAGAGPARNRGLSEARGEYVMFLDCDDRCDDRLIEKLVSAIEAQAADIAVCGYIFDVEGRERQLHLPEPTLLDGQTAIRRWALSRFPDGMVGYPWNKLYRRRLVVENGIAFPKMRRYQDGAFNLDMMGAARRISFVSEALYHYRANGTGEIYTKNPKDIWQLVLELHSRFEAKRTEWQLSSGAGDAQMPISTEGMDHFLQASAIMALENTFSPGWGMSPRMRIDYFESMAQSGALNASIRALPPKNRYYAGVLYALLAGRYGKAMRLIRLKCFAKRYLKGIFFRMKKHQK